MTTRRSFLKGLAALSGGYIAARFLALEIPGHENILLEPEIIEALVTRANPLAHLILDGERFELLHLGDINVQADGCGIWYSPDPNSPGLFHGLRGHPISSIYSWETDCDFALEDFDRMESLSRRVDVLPMMITSGVLGNLSFHGLARVSQTAIAFNADRDGYGSVVLVGTDFLRVEQTT